MRQIFLIVLFTLLALAGLKAQKQEDKETFTLRGSVKNYPFKTVLLEYSNDIFLNQTDTIPVDDQGNFTYRIKNNKNPQKFHLLVGKKGIYIFGAPGYDLLITANYDSLHQTKSIMGIGSTASHYQFILDSIQIKNPHLNDWFGLDQDGLVRFLQNDRKLKDSLVSAVFNRNNPKDRYLHRFKKLVQLDNKMDEIYKLLNFLYSSPFNPRQADSFLYSQADKKFLESLNKDDLMDSWFFRMWLVPEWLDYLTRKDVQNDPLLKNDPIHRYRIILKTFSGRVRDFMLYSSINSQLFYCKSLKQLDECMQLADQYGSLISLTDYKEQIAAGIENKKLELLATQKGMPAPSFALQNDAGDIVKLEDFRGKVVYLDLWASWCSSCREESPVLQVLYDRYKNDDRLAIISIAVLDDEIRWRKALSEDKPGWLQLFDKDGTVAKTYYANLIPQFVLIDKNGNIINFNAPWPSSGKRIEEIILREIENGSMGSY